VPLTVSPDRRTFTIDVADPLLRGAAIECLQASSFGRASWDPTQPDGGPAGEPAVGTFFAGFSPTAKRNAALKRCATRHPHDKRKRAACRRRVLARY
jgi:hypothetical protein